VLDFEVGAQSGSLALFYWSGWLALLSLICWFFFWLTTSLPNGAPRLVAWLEALLVPVNNRVDLWVPWRRKQLQRDFSSLLAMLLDAGFSEAKALLLAARGTANGILLHKAQRAVQALQQGAKLTEAVQELDPSGEFKWRLENAAASNLGFAPALRGWEEALDAKAYAQEQAASQVVSTGMVFLNGAMVALIAVGLFRILLSIIEEVVLW
jgi:type II secretory pathway component PulF